ncbi:MAG: SufD family Fe-S cluster assembly protein [Actinomycetota bacterium]|nr:SufD family Fe-S cluster assembly protein [Actinomycetota bacterium]
MRGRRSTAFQRFEAADLPTESAEEWRYSRVEGLELSRYRPSAVPPEAPLHLPAEVTSLLADAIGTVIVTHDGWTAELPALPSGVELDDLSVEDSDVIGSISGEPDPFVALNAALAPSPLRLRVGPRTVVDAPIVIVHVQTGAGTATFPRTVVELGSQAEATVLEIMAVADGATGDTLTVPVTELDVADAANLRYVHVQLLRTGDWQIALQASRVARDATLTSTAVALGGHYARLRTDSALIGQGGTTRLLAAYFGAGEQMHDFRTVQDHRAPKASSDLVYKGAVANRSRSVYTGLIRVEKGAAGTNALQTNRNLVLHEGAHAESVPNLEIEDNDVRCSHASAVGPIAEDQRFYLESRGVPSDVAERLIALGFLDEIFVTLPVAGTGAWLRAAVAAKLDAAEEVEAGLAGTGADR